MPLQAQLSKAEKQFVEDGVRENVRSDGRSRLEFRPFTLDTGVIVQANGSSKLTMGVTEILVGVKCSIGTPSPDHPDWGRLGLNVEGNPSVWDASGSSSTSNTEDQERLKLTLTQQLTRIFTGDSVMFWETLRISKSHCWVLMVEALVLESGGNLLDALSLAIRAALADTKIPQISVVEGTHKGKVDQIEVSDDPRLFQQLDLSCLPLTVTLLTLAGSDTFVVDPTAEEERCDSTRVTFAFSPPPRLRCCGVQKAGPRCALRAPQQLLPALAAAAAALAARLLQQVERQLQLQAGEGVELAAGVEIPHFGLTTM